MDPKGRVAAITGASAGIGLAIAEALAASGTAVVLGARRGDRLAGAVSAIRGAGGRAEAVTMDVTSEADVLRLTGKAQDAFGGLDIMVCNAGFGYYGTVEETDPDVMRRMMDVNFFGTFYGARAALPVFRRQGHGHLVIVSSIVGARGIALMSGYTATKAAQVGFAESLRAELVGTDIHVSVVLPVSTETEFKEAMARDYGHSVQGLGPKQSAATVARAVVDCIRRPRAEVYPLPKARALAIINAVAPGFADRLVQKYGAAAGTMTAEVPATVMTIATAVKTRGGRALIVGGWVRDRLLGRPNKDADVEVFGIPADELRPLLGGIGRVNTVGESFTVYKVDDVDVALPRTESKIGRGHRAFEVTGDPHLSTREAARRRDFTVNAIYYDPLAGEYIDPFEGRQDIERGVLKAVDRTTFGEDSLRVLRGVQFAARFGFTLEPETRELMRTIPLDDLPAERIWGEVEKLLLQAARPSIGFEVALDLGVVDRLFPEMKALIGCPQEPEWHPEGDVWIHTLMVVDQARQRIDDLDHPQKVTVMLGAVCHDLGKPPTTAVIDGRIRSMEHEQAGIAPSSALLDRLNVHTIGGFDVREQVLGIVAHHLKPLAFFKSATPVGDGAFRRLAQKVDLELLARVAESDCLGRTGRFDCGGIRWFLERARELGVQHEPPDPILKGRHLLDLGVAPGPGMGAVLREVFERQLDGRVTTLEEGLAAAREVLAEKGSFPED